MVKTTKSQRDAMLAARAALDLLDEGSPPGQGNPSG